MPTTDLGENSNPTNQDARGSSSQSVSEITTLCEDNNAILQAKILELADQLSVRHSNPPTEAPSQQTQERVNNDATVDPESRQTTADRPRRVSFDLPREERRSAPPSQQTPGQDDGEFSDDGGWYPRDLHTDDSEDEEATKRPDVGDLWTKRMYRRRTLAPVGPKFFTNSPHYDAER